MRPAVIRAPFDVIEAEIVFEFAFLLALLFMSRSRKREGRGSASCQCGQIRDYWNRAVARVGSLRVAVGCQHAGAGDHRRR